MEGNELQSILPPEGTWLRDYYEWAKESTDAPPIFHLFTGLSVLATAISDVYLNVGMGVNPNIWVALLADTTFARKTSSLNLGKSLLRDKDFENRIMPDSVTPESFCARMSENPTSTLFWSELGGSIKAMEKSYMAGFKQDLTQIYDGHDYEVLRRQQNGSFIIRDPRFSLVGASSLKWFEESAQNSDISGGFLTRFMFVCGASPELNPYPSPTDKEKRMMLIARLKEIRNIIGAFECDVRDVFTEDVPRKIYHYPFIQEADAVLWYRGWFSKKMEYLRDLEDSGSNIVHLFRRFDEHAKKIALLLRISRMKDMEGENNVVSLEDTESACKIVDFLNKESFNTLSGMFEQNKFSAFAEKIKKFIYQNAGIQRRELSRRFHLKKRELDEYVDFLKDTGYIEEKESGFGSSQSIVYFPKENIYDIPTE